MKIDDMIRKLRDQMNNETRRYNDLTESLNACRASETVDSVREAQLVKERAHAGGMLDTLRDRIAEMEREKAADDAVAELQNKGYPTNEGRQLAGLVHGTGRREGQYLSLRSLSEQLRSATPGGMLDVRALVASGSTLAPAELLDNSPVDMGKPATALLDVLPVRTVETGEYSYLRQTTRTNNAAPVAVSATKPTSVFTLTRINGTLQVVAHLSEPIHEPWLSDVRSLEQFIESEMAAGIGSALENQILNGNGTAPQLEGIIGASTGTQAYATSPLVTIRTGLAQIEAAGLKPSAVVLASADWLAIETATLTAGNYVLGQGTVGAPLDAIKRTVWGVPVVVSTAHTAGTAVLLSVDSVDLVTDGGVLFVWGRVNDDFAKNQIRARAEIRAQVEVFRPSGIIVADLTA